LHRAKVQRVREDPELYRAFDDSVSHQKAFVKRHLANMERQMLVLVERVLEKRKMSKTKAASFAAVIRTAMLGFHSPKLVVAFMDDDRESLLRFTLDAVLSGLGL
jgi:Tetracyclin repressor-like, C-terminal domain